MAATGLAAQEPAFAECNADRVRAMTAAQLGPWASFAPETLKSRFEPARRRGAWSAIVDTLAMLYGLERPPAELPHPPASLDSLRESDRVLLAAELDSTRDELRAGERDSTARLNGRITTKRFAVESRVFPPVSVRLFVGRAPGPIPLDALRGTERRSVCWLALAVNDLVTLYGGAARAALADALATRAERWDNFMRRGYSMTPLELLVNGAMPRPELEPPRYQLVLGHVSPGEEMLSEGVVSLGNLRRRTVLVFEPLGVINYSERYDSYKGAALVLAYPDSGGLASGVMVHHSALGHVALLWRPKGPSDSSRGAVLLSLDLYRFLAGVPEQWKKVKDAAIARCLANAPACVANP